MKVFFIKSCIIFALFFLLFQVTIGSTINEFKNSMNFLSNREQRDMFKEKLRDEIKKGSEKEKYFSEEDRVLISNFLKKVLKELELIK